jgi:hypothetical protein
MNTAVSVVSLASASAIASPSVATSANDPIFDLIEAHKASFITRLQKLEMYFADEDDLSASEANDAALHACNNAAMELVNVVATSAAGVFALLEYVDAFNRGEFTYSDMKSSVCEWPNVDLVDEDVYDAAGSEPGELGFAFAVLLNVRDALEGIHSA